MGVSGRRHRVEEASLKEEDRGGCRQKWNLRSETEKEKRDKRSPSSTTWSWFDVEGLSSAELLGLGTHVLLRQS